jgi:phage tail protein X
VASYNKFQQFVEDLLNAEHNFAAAGDVFKVYLSNTTPDAAADAVKADLAEFAGGTGYTSGGTDVQNTVSEAAGTASVIGTDVVWTAGAADWNQFRYVVLYNDTNAAPLDPLVAWWDYGTGLTLGNGETFTVDFGSSIFTLA